MTKFIGGSAPAMANQLMEGYILINPVMLKRFTLEELRSLRVVENSVTIQTFVCASLSES